VFSAAVCSTAGYGVDAGDHQQLPAQPRLKNGAIIRGWNTRFAQAKLHATVSELRDDANCVADLLKK